jgi:hypothetical protein
MFTKTGARVEIVIPIIFILFTIYEMVRQKINFDYEKNFYGMKRHKMTII